MYGSSSATPVESTRTRCPSRNSCRQNLAAVLEPDGVAIGVGLGSDLDEDYLLGFPHSRFPLQALGNIAHNQARARRHAYRWNSTLRLPSRAISLHPRFDAGP